MSRIDELVSDPETKCSAWIEEVRQCVAEERARCAKIADEYSNMDGDIGDSIARDIAKGIREGK